MAIVTIQICPGRADLLPIYPLGLSAVRVAEKRTQERLRYALKGTRLDVVG
jgi:hypothetical protein